MQLRYYQEEAVQSVFDYFMIEAGNPIIAMPTGTGKSLVIAELCRRAMTLFPGTRILMLTHVKELIEQNMDKVVNLWPTAPAGIYSAGLKRRDITADLLFAGIQSVGREPHRLGHRDLLIVDECHLISPSSQTVYRQVIDHLLTVNPKLKVIGLTATYYRLKSGLLIEGEDRLFTDICYDITKRQSFNRLINEGYLAPLVSGRTNVHLDTEGVKTTAGEFNMKDLQDKVDDAYVTQLCIDDSLRRAEARDHWMVFTTGVEHTEHTWDLLEKMGVPSVYVHSKMKAHERDEAIRLYKSGEVRAIVNNNVLTTGFDAPHTDHIMVLRPTKSASLHVQLLGRGTRPAPGKVNCLVSDYARNIELLGPINDPKLPSGKKGKKGGMAPVRICDECSAYSHASARFCENCGVEFPVNIKYQGIASTADVVARDEDDDFPQVEDFTVDRVVYDVNDNRTRNKPDTVKVSYYCGIRKFSEILCFDHPDGNYAKKKARDWWRKHENTEQLPNSVKEAMERIDSLPTPKLIKVWLNTKYPQVMNHGF